MNQQTRIEKAIKAKQERIDKRINIKDRNIAYFNSVNAAIEITKTSTKGFNFEELQEEVIKWRDWFYEQWTEWYQKTTTIQPVDMKAATKQGKEFLDRLENDAREEKKVDDADRKFNEAAQIASQAQKEQDNIPF